MTTDALARPRRLDLDTLAHALGLVVDLLDHINRLEATQRRPPPDTTLPRGAQPWT